MAENKNGGKFAMGIVDALLGKDQQKPDDQNLPEFKSAARPFSSGHLPTTEAALAQSENLRVAQQRLIELEEEIDRLRRENEQLIAAGRTLNQRVEELTSRHEKSTRQVTEMEENFSEEKRLLMDSIQAKDREMGRFANKVEELEMRLATDLKKIRVRERELENRLEIMKMEGSAVIRNKDEIILDLKRRIDQMTLDMDHHRSREGAMNERIEKDGEKIRRVVKAMRLALSLLEEEDANSSAPLKKVK